VCPFCSKGDARQVRNKKRLLGVLQGKVLVSVRRRGKKRPFLWLGIRPLSAGLSRLTREGKKNVSGGPLVCQAGIKKGRREGISVFPVLRHCGLGGKG